VALDDGHGRSAAQGTGLVSALPGRDAALTTAGHKVVLSPAATGAIGATYLLMGLVVSAYGPLLGLLSHRFGISLPVAGSIISLHYAGSLAGVVAAMVALTRWPGRFTVMTALGVTAAGCASIALAPTWPLFLCGIAVIGAGFGALVIGLNQLVAYSEGRRRTALLNGLNGVYSAGAVIGPIVIASLAASYFSAVYIGAGIAGALLIVLSAGIQGRLPVVAGARSRPGWLVGVFVIAIALYVGFENAAGGWIPSDLQSTGLTANVAAAYTSVFWLALALGRLLIAVVPARASERQVVLTGAVVAVVALLVATQPKAAPYAYVVMGFAIAPIFPTAIGWLAKLRPGDAAATQWVYPAGSIGGVVVPGALGAVVGVSGVGWTPAVLAAVAILLTGAFAAVRR
jgi:fucose permease